MDGEVYSSDADSEEDRRAYGQYSSLALDSDIDEDAAAYFMSVRSFVFISTNHDNISTNYMQLQIIMICVTV